MNNQAIDLINTLHITLSKISSNNATNLNYAFTPTYYYYGYFYSLGKECIR